MFAALPPTGPLSKRLALLLIFIAASVIRLVFITTLQDGFYFSDSRFFDQAALALIQDGHFAEDFNRAPLYPVFLSYIYDFIGTGTMPYRVIQSLGGGLIAVLIALIGMRLGGYWVGATAGLMWCIYPMAIFVAGILYPSTLITALLVCGVFCLVAGNNHPKHWLAVIAAGVLFGLGTLTKPVMLAATLAMTAWIYLFSRRNGFWLASAFLLSAALVVTPWTVRQSDVHGKFVLIEARSLAKVAPWAATPAAPAPKKQVTKPAREATGLPDASPPTEAKGAATETAAAARPPAKPKPQKQGSSFQRMIERMPREFLHFFELYPQRVGFLNQANRDRAKERVNPKLVREIRFGSSVVMTTNTIAVGALYVFGLIGIITMARNRAARPYLAMLLLLILSFALTYSLSWGKIRYRVPVDPYIMLISAWGFVWTVSALLSKLGMSFSGAANTASPNMESRSAAH